MDFEALKRGETAALSSFIDMHASLVWQLARRGFAIREDDHRAVIFGVHRADELAKLTVSVFTDTLAPARRAKLDGPEESRQLLLEVARSRLTAAAQPEGRELTIDDEARESLPSGVVDLDQFRTQSNATLPAEGPKDLDPEERESFRRAQVALETITQSLGPKDASLLQRRLRGAEPRSAVATALAQSHTAVKEGERRLVRHLLHQLKRLHVTEARVDEAELEALLHGDEARASLPARTAERIRADVLRRTFVEEPRPYASRATLAFAVLGASLVLYGLMFFGVLPGPGDDPEATAEVLISCAPNCAPDSNMDVRVRAPARARRLALWLKNGNGEARPLLPNSDGRGVTLPLGAKVTTTAIAQQVAFPRDAGPGPYEVVAVFSSDRFSIASLQAHVEGSRLLPKVVTHTHKVGP